MSPRPPLVTFLSDFGLADEFVGVVHAVIARLAPGAAVVDLAHQVPRHDVRAGALTLWRASEWLVPGVVLAVVDPGVGTGRRAVALEVPSAGAIFVGPDNGLLLPAALHLGLPTSAVELPDNPRAKGATFAGRDVFAPAAARAAAGVPIGELGRAIDPSTLQGDPIPEPILESGEIKTEILWIDHFGNAQLNITAGHARQLLGAEVTRARTVRGTVPVRVVGSYGEIEADHTALVIDSYGLLALSRNRSSASSAHDLRPGQPVWLCPQSDHPR
ncbi:MAG: SAM-dependent chlorinase/fluorinase [Acidimicrobiales bacterium]|nr:SAM-dependent chlorinase/fluorinase [Acidimicrobiales bacterium]